jgi:hypothetical protein
MTVTSKLARFNFRILAAVLTLFGTVACSTQASTPNTESSGEKSTTPAKVKDPAMFSCVQQGSGWATRLERGNSISKSPFITWNTTEFGSEFTPENRCKIVSEKLTDAVAKNGGLLGNLKLTTRKLDDRQTVVCVITPEQQICNRDNMLFTLSKENAKDPDQALAKITNFAYAKSNSSPIEESGYLISLETLVNRLLPENSGF